jgi:hypothetical protein
MKNFRTNDFAFNKYSAGIVYHFADGTTMTVTLEAYLDSDSEATADKFLLLKKLSDEDYSERDDAENAQTKKNVPLGGLEV